MILQNMNKRHTLEGKIYIFHQSAFVVFVPILTLPTACGDVFNNSTKVVKSAILYLHLSSKMRFACILVPYDLVSIHQIQDFKHNLK